MRGMNDRTPAQDPDMGGDRGFIVVVLGMHRSGTSLCANLLSTLGIDMCDDPLRHETNPRGHWERWEIVAFHDRILELFDRNYYQPQHAFALPAGWWADDRVRGIRDEMIAWLATRMGRRRLFGFKDPRTCRMLPLWREVLSALDRTPRFVLCVRDPAQVARSLVARSAVLPDQRERSTHEYRWAVYNAHAVHGIGAAPVAILPYEDWFAAPHENLARLVAQAGLGWSPDDPMALEAADTVIDPALRHDAPQPVPAPAFCRQMHRLIRGSAPNGRLNEAVRTMARDFIAVETLNGPAQAELSLLRQRAALPAEPALAPPPEITAPG